MKMSVSKEAARWYAEELDLKQGDCVQFFVQLYGHSHHSNYSLGIAKEQPHDLAVSTVVDGITFYFNEGDAWFLDQVHLHVDVQNGDIAYTYEKLA